MPRSTRPFSSIYLVPEGLITLLTNQRASAQPPFFFFLRQHPLKRRGRLTERPVLPTKLTQVERFIHRLASTSLYLTSQGPMDIQEYLKHSSLSTSYPTSTYSSPERIFSIKTSRNNGTPNHCDRLWVIAHSSFSHEAYWWSSSFDQYWHFLFHEALLAGYKICSWDLRSSLPDFTLEHIYLCLGYIVHLHCSTGHPLHINIDQQVSYTHAHTLRPLLSMVHPFLCSLRLYHMISRHETFDLEITSEPFVLAFPVFSFITWSDIMWQPLHPDPILVGLALPQYR